MAIRVQPPGMARSYAELGRLAGVAKARSRQEELNLRKTELLMRDIAERRQEAAREKQARQSLFAKMRSESRMIEAEKTRAQTKAIQDRWNLEKFNRSLSWQVEKAEMVSRADFARREKERQEKIDKYNAQVNAIIESDILSDREKQLWLLQLETKMPFASAYLKQQTQTPQQQLLNQIMATLGGEEETTEIQPTTPTRTAVVTPGVRERQYYGAETVQPTATEEYPQAYFPTLPAEPTSFATTPATPQKPVGYPDAVWNDKLQAWTVIRNGQIGILRKKQ